MKAFGIEASPRITYRECSECGWSNRAVDGEPWPWRCGVCGGPTPKRKPREALRDKHERLLSLIVPACENTDGAIRANHLPGEGTWNPSMRAGKAAEIARRGHEAIEQWKQGAGEVLPPPVTDDFAWLTSSGVP